MNCGLVNPLEGFSDWKLDWDEALRSVDGDPELLREVMAELLMEMPRLLAELDSAVAVDDAVMLRRAAHTLRGNLRFFGETDAGRVAEQIDSLAHGGKISDASDLLPSFQLQIRDVVAEVKCRMDSSTFAITPENENDHSHPGR